MEGTWEGKRNGETEAGSRTATGIGTETCGGTGPTGNAGFYSPTLGPKNHNRSADCSKVERHWEDVAEEYRERTLGRDSEGTRKGDLEETLGRIFRVFSRVFLSSVSSQPEKKLERNTRKKHPEEGEMGRRSGTKRGTGRTQRLVLEWHLLFPCFSLHGLTQIRPG